MDAGAQSVVRGRIRAPRAHGVRRRRLLDRLTGSRPRVGLVVAPAGSGKTTLLAQVAEAEGRPVAWLTCESLGGELASFLAHLRASIGAVEGGLAGGWPSVDDALADLERGLSQPLLLIVDDLHAIADRPAADALRLLLENQPEDLHVLLASRTAPRADLNKLRLAGQLVEVDADMLRFRTWEVEDLFEDCYGTRLTPEEAASLTRGIGGWAAGLQLFYLATRGQPHSERARILAEATIGTRLTREYLAAHVLNAVDGNLRSFLVRTSVLDELTGRRCDRLLGGQGAAQHLAELERRGLFVFREGDGHTYRYHDVLRTYLLDAALGELGPDGTAAMHRQAGAILEAEGALTDAIRSYSRSEDWDEVRRVLGQQGQYLASDPGSWIDLLPDTIRDHDPWVLLALARRLVAEGAFERAGHVYRQAAERAGPHAEARLGARERRRLDGWMHPSPGRVTDWVQVARDALVQPRRHLGPAPPGPPVDRLVHGFAHLVAGDIVTARGVFDALLDRRDLSVPVETAALVCRAVCAALDGDGAAASIEEAQTAAKLLGVPAVLRLAQGLEPLGAGTGQVPIDHLLRDCRRAGDRWGQALLQLFHGIGLLTAGADGAEQLREAEAALDELGAPALAAWATATAVLADLQQGRPVGAAEVRAAERAGGRAGPLPYAMALLAVAALDDDSGSQRHARRLAMHLGNQCGAGGWLRRLMATLDLAGQDARLGAAEPPPAVLGRARPRVVVRCLGHFELTVDGRPLDTSGIRPRNLALLRLLCLHANRPVHREQLVEWIWPGRSPAQGGHSLQVAISALRRVLEPEHAPGQWSILRREGSVYRLTLDGDDDADIRVVERHLAAAAAAGRTGNAEAVAAHSQRAIAAYSGDLLPDDGPAEWVVAEREQLQRRIAEAFEHLSKLAADAGDHDEAARLAEEGLALDRYRDRLWQRAIGSLDAAGNHAAARATRERYERLLAELQADGP
jgi:DNA-binding SARP family transcriptional activator